MTAMKELASPSVFKTLNVEYFDFEEDFVEENMRCIPMIVRFKMDLTLIKLKLSDWSRFSVKERIKLAISPCDNREEITAYKTYLVNLVKNHTGKEAVPLQADKLVSWANVNDIPVALIVKAAEHNCSISVDQWRSLTNLQRYALLKLLRPGHENKFFPVAMLEFNLALPSSCLNP